MKHSQTFSAWFHTRERAPTLSLHARARGEGHRDHRRHERTWLVGGEGVHRGRREGCRRRCGRRDGRHRARDAWGFRSRPRRRCHRSRIGPGAISRAVDDFGAFHALYHVAGGSGRRMGDGPLHEITDDGWRQTLDLNLTSLFHSNRAAARHFLEHAAPGAVLNMSLGARVLAVAGVFRDARLCRRESSRHRSHEIVRRLLRAARHPVQRHRAGAHRHADVAPRRRRRDHPRVHCTPNSRSTAGGSAGLRTSTRRWSICSRMRHDSSPGRCSAWTAGGASPKGRCPGERAVRRRHRRGRHERQGRRRGPSPARFW